MKDLLTRLWHMINWKQHEDAIYLVVYLFQKSWVQQKERESGGLLEKTRTVCSTGYELLVTG